MATTIIPSDLTVTINESYTLNGVDYGNNIVKVFSNNGRADQRILKLPTSQTKICSFIGNDSGGFYQIDAYKYCRFTNLDDTNFIRLGMYNGTDTFWIKLKAGESFFLMNNDMDAIESSSLFGSFADITEINGISDTAACNLEFLVVTS